MRPEIRMFLRTLPDRAILMPCTCGPVGYWGKAPGTNGTALGIALYTVVFFQLSLVGEVLLLALLIAAAILLCDEAERRLQKRDPGEIIIDEVVAVPLCFLGLNQQMLESGYAWLYMLAGFGLFRLFDVLKPFGISKLQKYPGGVGVVLDDLAAAVATHIVLRLFAFALGGW